MQRLHGMDRAGPVQVAARYACNWQRLGRVPAASEIHVAPASFVVGKQKIGAYTGGLARAAWYWE